jgi:uncharacterized protein (TIGR02001 family)
MSWAILMLGASVMAGDNSPATLEAHLTLVSDYRSRGLSSSREEPAVQGGATIINGTGAYLGGWASSLEPSGDARSEVNVFAGYAWAQAGFEWEASVTAYAFPNQDDTAYGELTLAASRAIGAVTTTLGFAYAPAQDNLETETATGSPKPRRRSPKPA